MKKLFSPGLPFMIRCGRFIFTIKQFSNWRFIFLTALLIGSIGAFGQGYLLYHELGNCLPFKEFDADFHRNIANIGILVAPIAAVASGYLFGLKRFWLSAVVPVAWYPLLFACVFKIVLILREASQITHETWHFDGQNPILVEQEFILHSLSLAFGGLIIGGICAFLLAQWSKQKPALI